jgi:hypothetical protein
MKASIDRLEREKKELQGLVERKVFREEELERELDNLQRTSVISNAFSDRTATQEKRNSGRDSKGTVLEWRGSRGEVKPMAPMVEADSASSTAGSAILWCEICESGGHDILTCPNIDGNGKKVVTNGTPQKDATAVAPTEFQSHFKNASISSQDPDRPKPLLPAKKGQGRSSLPPPPGAAPTGPLPNPMASAAPSSPPRPVISTPKQSTPKRAPPVIQPSPSILSSLVAGMDGTKDPNKWCAICEHDGHDSINCSLEDQF